MKIIQVMPEFGLAGAEIMCENLTYELISLGNEVIVVSLYDYHSAITKRMEDRGIRIEYLQKKSGLDLSVILKLKKMFSKEKPDVIHTHRYVMQYSIPAAILSGVKKRVHTVHNIAQKENTPLARKINKLFYKFANVIPVAISNEIKKTIIEEYKIMNDKIPVIINGIDLEKCILKDSYTLNNAIQILHIGRFSEQKNHVGLINAFAKYVKEYPNAVLNLIGDGEKRTQIESLVKSLQIEKNVVFRGLQDNVYEYLKNADIFVLPSLYEGVPMTLLEAMGSGLPIIATDVGGVSDILTNNEEALLIAVDDGAIENALFRFSEDEALREKCGKNARLRSEQYSSHSMARLYMEAYSNGSN